MFAAGLFTGLIVGVILTGTSLWAWQVHALKSQHGRIAFRVYACHLQS